MANRFEHAKRTARRNARYARRRLRRAGWRAEEAIHDATVVAEDVATKAQYHGARVARATGQTVRRAWENPRVRVAVAGATGLAAVAAILTAVRARRNGR